MFPDVSEPLAAVPDGDQYENFWYHFWERRDCFASSVDSDAMKKFCMILPPPNITGDLHLGHSLTVAIQDAIIRHKKMTGYSTSWIPGYDHAGIATYLIIDKLVTKSRNQNSKDLSQEEYKVITDKWKVERISQIRSQMKMMGALLDHSREYFTLDQKMSDAVKEAFVRLFDDGLIFRDKTLVNWSFFLKSTLSDIEIEWLRINGPTKIHVPGFDNPVTFGEMYSFSYPLVNDLSGRSITVATTRPETIMADVAVAVNPDDHRYKDLIGRHLLNPFTGVEMPVIADARIDLGFGSGAMKVTPGHSPTDYEIGKDHGLAQINVFDDNGCINCDNLHPEVSKLNGLNRFEAKLKVVELLKERGMLVKIEPHETTVPVCARSKDVIESCLKDQWFIKTSTLVEAVKEALNSGQIRMTPESGNSQWINWCNDKDWCISRQIRWGHQVPAYKVIVDGRETGNWVAAKDDDEAITKASKMESVSPEKITLNRDQDVLDTWFSSSLLSFSALGWPEKSIEAEYPLSLMETGHDILGFWVHRMALLSYKLTGRFGFNDVLLHGMICDSSGKKMTKSLGNVINPIDVVKGTTLENLLNLSKVYQEKGLLTKSEMERAQEGQKKVFPSGIPKCGSDALRLSLYQNDVQNKSIKLDIANITHNRSFINKMWQTMRYINGAATQFQERSRNDFNFKWIRNAEELNGLRNEMSPLDLWILSRLSSFVSTCNKSFDTYEFHHIYTAAHNFWIQSLCDIYLENMKSLMVSKEGGGHQVNSDVEIGTSLKLFAFCLDTSLRLLHPLIPFISEELFQRLHHLTGHDVESGGEYTSILERSYPRDVDFIDWSNNQVEEDISLILMIVSKLRSVIKDLEDHKKKSNTDLQTEGGIMVEVSSSQRSFESISHSHRQIVSNLVKKNSIQDIKFLGRDGGIPKNWLSLYREVDGEQKIDIRIKPRIELIELYIDRLSAKEAKLMKQLQQLSGSTSRRQVNHAVRKVLSPSLITIWTSLTGTYRKGAGTRQAIEGRMG